MMISPIQELLDSIQQHLPKEDFVSHKDLKRVIEAAASRLNLVTRDQFDAQTAVLQRTREKVEALETKLSLMEKNHS